MSSKKIRNSTVFTEAFEKALKLTGFKQKDIAAKAGFPTGRISEYATGRTEPTIENVSKIVSAMGLSLSKFFGLIETDQKNDTEAVKTYLTNEKPDEWKDKYISLLERQMEIQEENKALALRVKGLEFMLGDQKGKMDKEREEQENFFDTELPIAPVTPARSGSKKNSVKN